MLKFQRTHDLESVHHVSHADAKQEICQTFVQNPLGHFDLVFVQLLLYLKASSMWNPYVT